MTSGSGRSYEVQLLPPGGPARPAAQFGASAADLIAVLKKYKAKKTATQTLHDWAAMVALDAALDRGKKATLHGGKKSD